MTQRGTGKTKGLVETLQPNSIVVTHSDGMKHYIEQMIRDLRPKLTGVKVVVVSRQGDAIKLQGESRHIAFDHACFGELPSNVQREEMLKAADIARHINGRIVNEHNVRVIQGA